MNIYAMGIYIMYIVLRKYAYVHLGEHILYWSHTYSCMHACMPACIYQVCTRLVSPRDDGGSLVGMPCPAPSRPASSLSIERENKRGC